MFADWGEQGLFCKSSGRLSTRALQRHALEVIDPREAWLPFSVPRRATRRDQRSANCGHPAHTPPAEKNWTLIVANRPPIRREMGGPLSRAVRTWAATSPRSSPTLLTRLGHSPPHTYNFFSRQTGLASAYRDGRTLAIRRNCLLAPRPPNWPTTTDPGLL